MKEQEQKMNLPKLDKLFTTQEQRDYEKAEKVEEIDISKISNFPDHPFKVVNDDKLQEMVNSVKEYGVILPVIVRPKEDGTYEMISGHRRKRACELAGVKQIRCIVKNLTVDSNIQREEILPSEKAFAYKMKLEAMKHQGKRIDLEEDETYRPLGDKLKSADIMGQEIGESARTIQRYIRLTYLIPDLLEQVDLKRIAFRPAVELSYLSEENQYVVQNIFEFDEVTPSLSQAIRLKKFPNELIKRIESIQDDLKINPYETLDDRREDEDYVNRILHLIVMDSKRANMTINETRINEFKSTLDRYNARLENARSIDQRFSIDEKMNNDPIYQLAKYIVSPEMKRMFKNQISEDNYEGIINKYFNMSKKDKLSQDYLTQGGVFDEKPFPEVTIQENMDLANKCAHWCNDDLNDILDTFTITDKEKLLKRSQVEVGLSYKTALKIEFKKRLADAIKDHAVQPEEERVNFDKLNDYLKKFKDKNEADRDYSDFCNNENVIKINNLIQKYIPGQKLNFDTIDKYSKMFQLNQKTLEFFNLKNKLIEVELELDNIARKDFKETEGENIEKSTISFLIKDDKEKEDGEGTYRIITMNKDFYENYVQFNNAVYVNGSLAEFMSKEAGTYDKDDEKDKTAYVKEVNDYLADKDKYYKMSSLEFDAMMKCGNVSVCHAPESLIEKLAKDKKLDEIDFNPPVCVQCMARYGVSFPTDVEIPEKVTKKVIGNLEKLNRKNEINYKGDINSFKADHNLINEYAKDIGGIERNNG